MTATDPDRVFAYLTDFRNAKQWDSGTTSCEVVLGDGGPGTVYRNVSEFAGTTVELEYTTQTLEHVAPLMKPLLDRLGDRTAEQLKSTLDRL
ncbi:hypothetical protein GCM10023153_27760 [Ornithinibacter aureus]|uniref:Polyketide cyclase n=2 Tax=Ornithinibacter aureus TaxID=622664 RepID=A0ABP8K4D1_9MICO